MLKRFLIVKDSTNYAHKRKDFKYFFYYEISLYHCKLYMCKQCNLTLVFKPLERFEIMCRTYNTPHHTKLHKMSVT